MKCILNICQKNPTWCILYSPQTPSNASSKCISWNSPAKVALGACRRHSPCHTGIFPIFLFCTAGWMAGTCQGTGGHSCSDRLPGHSNERKPSVCSNCLLVSVALLSLVSTLPKNLISGLWCQCEQERVGENPHMGC